MKHPWRPVPASTIALSTLAATALLLAPSSAQQTDAPDPLAACSMTLAELWSQVDAGELAEDAASRLAELSDSSRCRIISTAAERTFLSGRIALAEGRFEAARRAFETAFEAPRVRAGDRPHRAEILYYRGLTDEATGQAEAARAAYTELAREHPADARVALILPVLDERVAATDEERIAAAAQAVETHNYTAAEHLLSAVVTARLGRPLSLDANELEPLLGDAIAGGDRVLEDATYQLGYLWYYWIRVKSASSIPLLAAVAAHGENHRANATYYLARAHMRAEDYDAARRVWQQFAESFRRDRRAHESTYYRGWLYLDREQFEQAVPGFEAYLDDYPRGSRRDRALWYLGWAYFRMERYADARPIFARLGAAGGYLEGAKGQYWEARCLREQGDEEAARETFESVAERYDLTYYGLLARQRLGWPLYPERDHTIPEEPRVRLAELGEAGGAMESLAALLEVGSAYHVARYYEDRRPERRLSSTLDQLLVRQAAGHAYDDFVSSRGHSGLSLRRAPDRRSLLHWVRRYPRPYDHWLTANADAVDIDPLWVWAHMQIESHYNTRFVSYADAQGLLQIIPKTGQNIAEALGEPYTEGMLMEPSRNLRYGTWYLAALEDEFGGQLPLAIAAYNSGAASMQRWVDENHDLPFDAFVEEIPYDQSREYVKKVIGMYAHYLLLYADDDHLEATMARLLPEGISAHYQGRIRY